MSKYPYLVYTDKCNAKIDSETINSISGGGSSTELYIPIIATYESTPNSKHDFTTINTSITYEDVNEIIANNGKIFFLCNLNNVRNFVLELISQYDNNGTTYIFGCTNLTDNTNNVWNENIVSVFESVTISFSPESIEGFYISTQLEKWNARENNPYVVNINAQKGSSYDTANVISNLTNVQMDKTFNEIMQAFSLNYNIYVMLTIGSDNPFVLQLSRKTNSSLEFQYMKINTFVTQNNIAIVEQCHVEIAGSGTTVTHCMMQANI